MPFPKMKLMSDVDGVLVDFNNTFANWMEEHHPELAPVDRGKWHFGLDDEVAWGYCEEFWETDWIRRLPFFEGAVDGLNSIIDIFQIHIVTALPHKYEHARRVNLSSVNYDSMMVIGRDKMDYIIDVLKPDIAIEDKPKNVNLLHETGIDVYYPDHPITKDISVGTRYFSWKELVEILRDRYDV